MSEITKRALAAALKDELRVKPISKITVTDITKACGVNRQTFYYHFQDIYDLVEWVCIQDTEKVLQQNRTCATWQEGLLAVFELAREDKCFIDNIFHSVSFEILQQNLYRLVDPLIRGVAKEKAASYTVREEDLGMIVDFYKYAFVGFLFDWIRTDMRRSPEEIVAQISTISEGGMEHALALFGHPKF